MVRRAAQANSPICFLLPAALSLPVFRLMQGVCYIHFSAEGDSVNSITDDFHKAVDEYLKFCASRGKEPEMPFKGSFNVRISADLHRRLALTAYTRGVSLNSLVEDAIRLIVNMV